MSERSLIASVSFRGGSVRNVFFLNVYFSMEVFYKIKFVPTGLAPRNLRKFLPLIILKCIVEATEGAAALGWHLEQRRPEETWSARRVAAASASMCFYFWL